MKPIGRILLIVLLVITGFIVLLPSHQPLDFFSSLFSLSCSYKNCDEDYSFLEGILFLVVIGVVFVKPIIHKIFQTYNSIMQKRSNNQE